MKKPQKVFLFQIYLNVFTNELCFYQALCRQKQILFISNQITFSIIHFLKSLLIMVMSIILVLNRNETNNKNGDYDATFENQNIFFHLNKVK